MLSCRVPDPVDRFSPAHCPAAVAERPPGPLRIALFSGNYNCVRDGANQALNHLVEHLLDREGAAVRVYSPTGETAAFAPAGDLVPVPSIAIPGRREYRLALGLPRSIRDDVDRFAPNLIHLSAPDLLGHAARRFARARGIPVVASLHTRFEAYLEHYGLRLLQAGMERQLCRFYAGCDHVLVPNAPIARELREQGLGHRVSIWGRGVDRSLFTPARRDLGWRRSLGYADDEPVILFFGRLVREKGIDIFADVIATARANGHRLRPLIVGEGPARNAFARRLPNANFLGHLSGADLGRAVASADILLNPSTTEAFGNVTLEAMAAGLAILSADVPSARALVRHGHSAMLVRPTDCDAYAQAIEKLIRSPAARAFLAANALADAARYEWDAASATVATTYRACLANAAASRGVSAVDDRPAVRMQHLPGHIA